MTTTPETAQLKPGTFTATDAGRAAARIVQMLRAAGFEAWLAGGCVRDAVLGVEVKDFDVATSALPEQVHGVFSKVVDTGVQFGTVTVIEDQHSVEVTTFRRDGVYRDGRRPTSLTFGVSARDDAERRDFTINALFGDPVSGQVVDYVGGLADLAARRLRAVGNAADRFDEDALRLLRCIRFAARFDCRLDLETERAARSRAHLLRQLSGDRIGGELAKMLTGANVGPALVMLERYSFMDEILPEVSATRGVPQPWNFHPEGDVFVHTVDATNRVRPRNVILTLAALFHDVGKTVTLTVTDRIRFHAHEPASSIMALPRLRKLRYSNAVIDEVIDLIDEHIRIGTYPNWRRAKQLRFLQKPNIDAHLSLHHADCSASSGNLAVFERIQSDLAALRLLPPVPEPLVRGDDLLQNGFKPGPEFKRILDALRDAQLEGAFNTREAALQYLRKNYHP